MMKSSADFRDFIIESKKELPSAARQSLLSNQAIWIIYQTILVINDLFWMIASFRIAFWVRFELSIPIFQLEITPYFPTYSSLGTLLVPLWLLIFSLTGLYSRANLVGGTVEYSKTFSATSKALLIMIIAGFLEPSFVIARGWLLMFWAFSFLFTSAGRFFLRRVVYWLRSRGYFLSSVVLVGANEEGLSLARQFLHAPKSGFNVLGFVDKKLPVGAHVIDRLTVLGSIDQLGEIVKKCQVDEIILASSAFSSRDHLLEIFKQYGISNGVNVRMSSGLYEIITTGLTVKEHAYVPLVGINKVRLTGIERVSKMLVDYLLTIPLLLFLSPFLLLIALGIKLTSPGPILHRRRVMGVNGRQFDAYKFRTMYVNGDEILEQYPELKEELNQTHKLKDDPRVTPLGKFLRKFSLDELPQLFNVLKQEMSLVGPRMISPEEMQEYKQMGINLLTVNPGITGLWQVTGRSDLSYSQRVLLDMHYIRNWNIWMDLHLIGLTIPAVLRGRGAY